MQKLRHIWRWPAPFPVAVAEVSVGESPIDMRLFPASSIEAKRVMITPVGTPAEPFRL